jgi:membrane-associated phospholipid phosphatase
MESVALGYAYGAGFKYLFGRRRPGDEVDVDDFKPFSGRFSMPSGETTHAFAMASVVAEQYPNWPVRILSYGLAATVAAGRIARDDHWLSDVFVAAALGTFMGKSVTWLNAERGRRSEERARLGLAPERERFAHSFRVSARSFQWNVRF